jgi:hypothetical protein
MVTSLALGITFTFLQIVPNLGPLVSLPSKIMFGIVLGFCAGSTFFLMGMPVIDVIDKAIAVKHGGVQ